MARKCKRVVVCGKARRMCWTGGKLSSNKPWKRGDKNTGTFKRRAKKRSTRTGAARTTARRAYKKPKKRTTRAKRVGMTCWKQRQKSGCRMLCQVKGKFVSNTKARGCPKGRKAGPKRQSA